MSPYLLSFASATIDQGDIFDACPIIRVLPESEIPGDSEKLFVESLGNLAWGAATARFSLIVLTQTCDLANEKATKVTMAVLRPISDFTDKQKLIQVRKHQVFGFYYLPPADGVDERVVDLRDLHTVDVRMVVEWERSKLRKSRLLTPYREHLAQQFAITFMRIGLPA